MGYSMVEVRRMSVRAMVAVQELAAPRLKREMKAQALAVRMGMAEPDEFKKIMESDDG